MKNLFYASLILFIVSCTKESDAPVIGSLTIQSTTIQKAEDANLTFSYAISDDNGLNRLKIDVIDDFPDARVALAPFFYTETLTISGSSKSETINIPIPFPDTEVGNYELKLSVQDIDGNETSAKRNFEIVD